ncbi:MAG TPA: hypothetical protein VFW83_07230 [Bryobacteraceae bacterium]|nr:hypothetical protein [Bryobacteraceae bacterium]
MGAIIARREDQTPTLTALRGRRKGEFSAEERAAAKFLLPHLRRAWTVYEKLELLIAGESVLDGLPVGIVFLVAGGVAVYANQCANDIFRANDGLSLRNGKPCAWDRRADASLNKSLKHASSPGRQTGPPAVGVPRVSGRRAYQVAIAPLRARFPQFTGAPGPMAVVFITDPERERPAKLDLLIQLFGLTRKEAEMAAKLSGAKSIEQVAEEMGITYGTVTFLNGNRVTFQTRESAFRGNALFNIIPGINLGATPASRYVQDGAAWTMPFDAISVSNLNNTNSITGTVTLQDSDGHAVATASIPSIPPGGAAGYLLIGRAPGDSLGLFPSSTTLPAGDDGIFHRILVVGLTGLTPTGQSFVLAQEYNGNSMLNLPVFGSPVP